ncbi:nad-dependent protein lipoamidase sirtuin-4 [Holotrichia oblita]|uniref:Nad-dependent protein lipoamidase sirtuin-4 n=1 Tax=Holotrichia oblita TaxID=644536 RepID=A0ACB9SJW5_HOLOL|nr:nad-dependent protein lipoamidase sirtuin-4 [Holotrichia oblita]
MKNQFTSSILHRLQALNYSTNFNFIPKHTPVEETSINLLKEFISESKRLLILTGAGISTESGIPDYRSEEVGLYARSNHKPMQYQQYLKSKAARQRYWARNFIGWPRFSTCQPNVTHISVRDLELVHDKVNCVVTQNVDSLHYKAGSKNVVELHGSAFRVLCLDCNSMYSRFEIQDMLTELNPTVTNTSNMIRPDGDVDIPVDVIEKFKAPFCSKCGGVLKPDIVFFGDNVPRERVERVQNNVSESDSLLVLGSSLFVFSGYRIVLQALEENKNVAIVNIGKTRADDIVHLKISAKCGDVLPKVC